MIYYIGNREMDMVKIGYSRDEQTIHTRIKQIQTYCPFHVEVIKIYTGTLEQEQSLHKRYKKFKTNHKNEKNEWFVLSKIEEHEKDAQKYDELMGFIEKKCSEFLHQKPQYWQFYSALKKMIVDKIESYDIKPENFDEFVYLVESGFNHFEFHFDDHEFFDELIVFYLLGDIEKTLTRFCENGANKTKENTPINSIQQIVSQVGMN